MRTAPGPEMAAPSAAPVRHGKARQPLADAELPPRENTDQVLWKMSTDRFQVFCRRAGKQNVGAFTNFSEAPVFGEKLQNNFRMERRTNLIDHARILPWPSRTPHNL
jgi:hypothetical protein